MANKKLSDDLVAKIEAIVREEYADYEQYFPSNQEKWQYQRKQKDYGERIRMRIKEELSDGRAAEE